MDLEVLIPKPLGMGHFCSSSDSESTGLQMFLFGRKLA